MNPLLIIDAIRPNPEGFQIDARLRSEHALVQDHAVKGVLLVSGAVWLEAMRMAVEHIHPATYNVQDLMWITPLRVESGDVNLVFNLKHQDTAWAVSVCSVSTQQKIAQAVYVPSQNRVAKERKVIPLRRLMQAAEITAPQQTLYLKFTSLGFEYGPSYRIIDTLWCTKRWSLAKLTISGHSEFVFDPGCVDAALQTSLGIAYARAANETAHLPFSVAAIRFYQSLVTARYIYAVEQKKLHSTHSYHLLFLNDAGELLMFMQNFSGRRLTAI